uniref:Poly [ADP-ribose] polymerase n=1 Tax=Terrapene triunguis TaxID=2587831 RepID=A0A674JDU8_9SAUR
MCTHVIVDNVAVLSSYHLKTIEKYRLPIVSADFVWKSAEEGKLLQIDDYESSKSLEGSSDQKPSHYENFNYSDFRFYTENDQDIPYFPQDFEVAKYDALEKISTEKGKQVVVIELQCSQESCEFPFRISAHFSMSDGFKSKKQFIATKTSEEVRENYEIYVEDLKNQDFLLRETFPPGADYLASMKLQELLLEEAINSSTLSQEISAFVELIWAEALGHLDHLLLEPVNNISLNDVSKGEGILLQIKNAMNEGTAAKALKAMMMEFYRIIRHKNGIDYNITKRLLSSKQDLCQLIRDMLNVCETSMSSPNPPSLAKYRALRCKIQAINPNSEEFLNVKQQVLKNNHSDCPVKVLQIYRVGRISETAEFLSNLGNVQSLFHASSVRNFVGILSRGLLLPKIVVEDHGMERTDIGKLGSGIYFSDSISTSTKYSPPSEMDGTRLLAVCNVALGTCLDLYKKDLSLTNAPAGYDSVHGVRKRANIDSDFEDDEFVVYKTCQVKMRYIVKFCLAGDQVKQFQPGIETRLEQDRPATSHCLLQPEDYALPSVNLLNHVKTGLQDTSGNPVPLEDIHIKGRIIDFIAQVQLVFQTYTNQNDNSIEAKYVFPLDGTAAVCGFEAFINGKHIVGKVKEKEQAHKEYREAISRGDGAYLMDQDAPDVFTVSVGNLPPKTTVLIKVTYITELSFQNGRITFQMPAAVAPCIFLVWSTSAPLRAKTDCKAVIRTVENSSLDICGFVLEIWISQVYLPRMWVEKHPNKESEACMLVFQPKFETRFKGIQLSREIIICLDCSNSMEGSTLQQAKQIALRALQMSCFGPRVNVIRFGTKFSSYAKDIKSDLAAVKEFIISATPTMGNTDLWKTLRYLSLLYPSQRERNILLLSDGHIQNESMTFQIVKENIRHTRLFTCGVGSTANHHMLRSLSQYGAGAYEYFDPKSKYNWLKKIESQTSRIFSPGCSSVSIKWQQFDSNAPEPLHAPAQIQSLFNNERLLVYGFIPRCTQATLNALINDQELQAMVSTTELQKTTGTLLHKLTARALIRDYEDGILHENETEHEMKKHTLKVLIINLSLENSIITQFTSFVAVEKRDVNEIQHAGLPNILELIAEEDIDFLPYMDWEHDTSGHGYLSDPHSECLRCLGESHISEKCKICKSFKPRTKCEHEIRLWALLMELALALAPARRPDPAPGTTSSVRSKAPSTSRHHSPAKKQGKSQRRREKDRGEGGPELASPRSPPGPRPPTCAERSSPSPSAWTSTLIQVPSTPEAAQAARDILAMPVPSGPSEVRPRSRGKPPLGSQPSPAMSVVETSFRSAGLSRSPRHTSTPLSGSPGSESPESSSTRRGSRHRHGKRRHSALSESASRRRQHRRSYHDDRHVRSDGFWNLSPELGVILDLDVDYLTNIFLAKKGIWSLGPKGREVLQLIATLLVLQFIRYNQQLEGITFKSLMKLDDSPTSSAIHWAFASVKKAVEWVRRIDRQFPAICHRLELGKDWDSATKKLLGIDLITFSFQHRYCYFYL